MQPADNQVYPSWSPFKSEIGNRKFVRSSLKEERPVRCLMAKYGREVSPDICPPEATVEDHWLRW
jgi:hypothetical protein